LRANSFFWKSRESGLFRRIPGVIGAAESTRHLDLTGDFASNREIDVYSAAAAKEAFGFADEIMKSEMRGTISDLKREPLKTP